MKVIYENKVTLAENAGVSTNRKITAENMNEIKTVINTNDDAVLALDSKIQETEWIYPTLLNGWRNYSSNETDADVYALVAYKKKNGVVYLRGLCKGGPIINDAIGSKAIFVLPSGFRTSARLLIMTKDSTTVPARVDIFANGAVQAVEGTTSGYFSLSNISFIADI